MFGAFGFSYCFLYNVELFPSHVRGFSLGLITFFFNLISSAIPFFGVLTEKLGVHFITCLMPFSLLAFVASKYLPETLNKVLDN